MPPLRVEPEPALPIPAGAEHVSVGGGLGKLRFVHGDRGLDHALFERGLELRFREGGESMQTADMTKKLKNLLQEAGVVPWMRDHIPLLFSDGRLVAVADLWMDAECVDDGGVSIHWENHPALY